MRLIHWTTTIGMICAASALACAPKDSSSSASTTKTDSITNTPTVAPSAQPALSDITPVRGSLAAVSDTALTVTTSAGDVHVIVAPPLKRYKTQPADLSKVTANTFVGVTSVAQPDDTQKATEIHIFPEELRGTGEGSNLMKTPAGSAGRSTMTNGAVAAAPGGSNPSRMTNGAVATRVGGSITVSYNGSSRVVAVPSDVPVTEIVATDDKLTPGTNVIVLAVKQPDGTLKASRVMIARKP
ncbi:MAG: hypothetical protein M3Y05_07100 [Gemmatimonadota bacterium]|nr:hypothetical protein [Gemmatimonadota bacterium]